MPNSVPSYSAEALRALGPEAVEKKLASLSQDELSLLMYDWSFWARPNQMLPPGDWVTWFPKCGRGWGKTRVGAETVRIWAKDFAFVNLIGATADDARDIMIEGESGILATCPRHERPEYLPSKRQLIWPNGARSLIFTADEPERLRGKQHMKTWCLIGSTLVTMGDGSSKAIQDVRPDDLVLTRKGPRRVLAISSHTDEVGRVVFNNGSEITGTSKHPLIRCDGVTICLSDLSIGDHVPTDTLVRILVQSISTARKPSSTNTDTSGTKHMGPFQKVMSSITKMVTRRTTVFATLLAKAIQRIRMTTTLGKLTDLVTKILFVWSNARTAEKILSGGPSFVCSAAGCAPPTVPNVSDLSNTNANTVGRPSSHDAASSAASVASTWEPVGSARVFDLGIEDEHEFFANGLLSHNCDEVASWRYAEAWDQMELGLRLGKKPQVICTSTPKPTKLVKAILANPTTLVTHGRTLDNARNLSPVFLDKIITKYQGTRLGRQELEAEVLSDNPGALWQRPQIDAARVNHAPSGIWRIVVGVDPAVTSNEDSDLTGIVVAGVDRQNPPHYYVLDDRSLVATPDRWATKAVIAYRDHRADCIVAEVNNGGEMVESVVRQVMLEGEPIGRNAKYTAVHATRGKAIRAEPIAALYEQGRVHHVGSFTDLEDQMCDWDPSTSTKSPDRVDALVWALTELSENAKRPMKISRDFMEKLR